MRQKHSNRKLYWLYGNNTDKLLEALETILFNIYVKFNENTFKQTLPIPIGENNSYLSINIHHDVN